MGFLVKIRGAGGPCLPISTPVLLEFKVPDTLGTRGSFCVPLKGKLPTCHFPPCISEPSPKGPLLII